MPSHLPQALQALTKANLASFGSAEGFTSGVMAKRSMARCIRLRQRLSARGVVLRVINNDAMAKEATPTFETVPDIRAPKPFNISVFPTTIVNGEYTTYGVALALRQSAARAAFHPVLSVHRHLLGVALKVGL